MTLPEFPESVSESSVAPQSAPRQAPLKFEPVLVPKLRAAHATLNKRFAGLLGTIEHDPQATVSAIDECARQFTAMRHIETVWLYPMLAKVVDSDAGARGSLSELRLVGLILARRATRTFDDLLQAVRAEVLVADAAARVSAALARYSAHSEQSVYPLYELLGAQQPEVTRVA